MSPRDHGARGARHYQLKFRIVLVESPPARDKADVGLGPYRSPDALHRGAIVLETFCFRLDDPASLRCTQCLVLVRTPNRHTRAWRCLLADLHAACFASNLFLEGRNKGPLIGTNNFTIKCRVADRRPTRKRLKYTYVPID
jgi:hypothetical protein